MRGRSDSTAFGASVPRPRAILAVSAHWHVGALAVTAMQRGAFDFLTKPVDLDTLEATIRRALQHGNLLRENQRPGGQVQELPHRRAVVGRQPHTDHGRPVHREQRGPTSTDLETGAQPVIGHEQHVETRRHVHGGHRRTERHRARVRHLDPGDHRDRAGPSGTDEARGLHVDPALDPVTAGGIDPVELRDQVPHRPGRRRVAGVARPIAAPALRREPGHRDTAPRSSTPGTTGGNGVHDAPRERPSSVCVQVVAPDTNSRGGDS